MCRAWRRFVALSLACIMTCFAAVGCQRIAPSTSPVGGSPASRVANLHAFARLYGVVRWFHPSDAAAELDWDQFAIDGAHAIVNVGSVDALRSKLIQIFAPVAPTVHIVGAKEEFSLDSGPMDSKTARLDVVAWQHEGYGDSIVSSGYMSKRTHRTRTISVDGSMFATLSQSIDAVPHRRANIRLRGKLRTANRAQGRMWLRVDRGTARGFYEGMSLRPVMSKSWASAEIVGTVDADATKVFFGTMMTGAGTTWYDDFELSVQAKDGSWTNIPIADGGFEAPDPFTTWGAGTGRSIQDPPNVGWSITIDHNNPAAGGSSLRVEQTTTVLTKELFEAAPLPGETVDIDLGSGLRARVPLALYSKNDRTIGDDPEFARRSQLRGWI